MQLLIRRSLCALLCVFLFFPLLPTAIGAEHPAEDISGPERITAQEGFGHTGKLFDRNTTRAMSIPEGSWLTLSHSGGIGSLYLIFDMEYGPYTVADPDTGESRTFGTKGFLHEYLDLTEAFGTAPNSVTITFPSGEARLNELYLFSPGKVPDFVQKWEPPKEGETDILLFPTHGDDEQLFFAGMLPYYAAERGYEVLVAYLTNHRNCGTLRCHEMLDGLWAVGVTTYPVFGGFGDHYSRSKARAYEIHQNTGESREALLGFVVEQLRRFKPQVAVGHDLNGEYGHGQHRMYGELLCQAVEIANDPTQYPETAERYGAWEVPKTYLHLWPENRINLDWDQPLARFGGMTAFQVSQQLGFPCHKSQYGGFAWYIAGYDRAADIPKYNPCQFGLYRTTVGPDTVKQDLFENLISYAQRDQKMISVLSRAKIRQLRVQAFHAFHQLSR